MSIREELLKEGWESKGKAKCEKCGEVVEVLMSEGGRKQYFNTEDHPSQAGSWHKFYCGLTFAMSAPAEKSDIGR